MLTPAEAELYAKICEFKLDNPEAMFPFSSKLAGEYMKFNELSWGW